MALTAFQRDLCRLIADSRLRSGESYVAGATALNELLGGARISGDIDLFHDTNEALVATWQMDRSLLEAAGYSVRAQRESPTFVQADVARGQDHTKVEWVRDSAYRFFPLATHPLFGLTLHPFDHATNKTLALEGRAEPRDWVDVIQCHDRVQPLGYLIWAACGKDPGLSPARILHQASRAHYSQAEIDALTFEGGTPDAGVLSRRWKEVLAEAREIVAMLPADQVGKCVLEGGDLCRLKPSELEVGRLSFHEGRIRGAWPQVASS